MKRLTTLSPIPRNDTTAVRSQFPGEASEHSGRMRVSLIDSILDRHVDDISALADPLIGTGSVCASAGPRNIKVYGCEYEERWVTVAKQVAANSECDATIWSGNSIDCPSLLSQIYDAILTSPPFPNAHNQGKSEMQQSLLSQRSTFAGNEFALEKVWGCGSKPDKGKWVRTLGKLLDAWAWSLRPAGLVFIHVKDFVREGKIVDVGEWVGEAFDLAELHLLGDYGAPLDYRSGFQEWKRFHQRKITVWMTDTMVNMECGHAKTYDKAPAKRPEKAVCPRCPKKNHVEVREERIIVGQSPA